MWIQAFHVIIRRCILVVDLYSTVTATAWDNITLACQVTSVSPPCSGHIWMFNSKNINISCRYTTTQATNGACTCLIDGALIFHISISLMKQTLFAYIKLVKPLLERIYDTSNQGRHVSATMSKFKFQDLRLVCWSRRREDDRLWLWKMPRRVVSPGCCHKVPHWIINMVTLTVGDPEFAKEGGGRKGNN